jgi:hypothetical protein
MKRIRCTCWACEENGFNPKRDLIISQTFERESKVDLSDDGKFMFLDMVNEYNINEETGNSFISHCDNGHFFGFFKDIDELMEDKRVIK